MIKQENGKDITNFISEKTKKMAYSINKKRNTILYVIHADEGSEKPHIGARL